MADLIARSLFIIAATALLLFGSPAEGQPDESGVRMVELDGRAVRVRILGLEGRRPGAPVVVFEAGATASLDSWRSVLPDVAARAPVVAYDRAGLGQSQWDGVPPTPRHATDRLRRLLRQIGADPPYILVGHSWGGMLMRYHAGYHPDEVAGLVLVDPAPMIMLDRSANLVPFDAVGAGQAGYEAYWNGFSALVSRSPPAAQAEFATLRALLDTELAERDLRPLPPVPLAVIVAGRFQPLPIYDQFPFDGRAYFEADLRQRIDALREWTLASPEGLLVVASATTHSVPRQAPDLIVWAVGRVLDSASDREAGAAAAAGGGLGVADLEGRAAEALDEIDGRAAHQLERQIVDDQGHPVLLHLPVLGLDPVGEAEPVLEAGAAAAFDRQSEDGRLTLALGDRGHPGGG